MSTTEANPPAQTGVAAQERPRMSYEEWLAWEHEGSLTEWVNGEVVTHMGVLLEHQRIVDFLNRLLGFFVEFYQLGCVISAPMVMRISPNGNGREPDLFFVSAERVGNIASRQLEGPADIVIEVVSAESVIRDRIEKFEEYQDGGVREYWIIDSRAGRQRIDVWLLDESGRYQILTPEAGGIYRSHVVPGFWLREAWLWQEQPDLITALQEVVGITLTPGIRRSQQASNP
jgi:Uma2 family endonuclease